MATASDNIQIAIGGSALNVTSGKKGFEYPTMRGRAWRLKAASGVSGVQATIYAGDRSVAVNRNIPFGGTATAPTYPSWNDQEVDRGILYPGEALRLDFTNASGVLVNVVWEVQAYP